MPESDAPLFSIICAYNKPAVLQRWLLPSLAVQNVPYEITCVENSTGVFKSAAAALNSGAKDAKGDFLAFVHQDVQLPLDNPDWLGHAAQMMRRLPDLGVAGVIGMTGDNRSPVGQAFNSITQGVPPDVWHISNLPIDHPTVVQTLDELLLIVPRDVFATLKFDENACPSWHLYGVDYALSVRRLNRRAYVLPLTLHHVSPGNVNADYYRTLKILLPKHRAATKWLYTGCGVWNTSTPVLLQKLRHKARSALRLAQVKLGLNRTN